MTYADNTSVSVEKSRGEIERTLGRYGATAFGYMTEALSEMARPAIARAYDTGTMPALMPGAQP